MKPMGLNEIRQTFLRFFEEKGHLRLQSAPLVPQNDASLLLINAGMAPLKPYFTGELAPPAKRAVSCQKCIRTPDIERVGRTSRHGTYFEMLGNFSFGDYFKSEACAWAWEFVTKRLEIPVDRLWVSIFLDDDEAFDIWTREVGVAPGRVVRLGRADNFWEIGVGPCGPCSEIYFDRGEQYGCGRADCAVGCDCDRYVEFWNLVFTQFDSDGKGHYTPLEKKNIDTGMGLDRMACIMQGTTSMFDVDTTARILARAAALTGAVYGQEEQTDISLRIITDHARSATMLISDGVTASNEGRGYVLRRLLRRAALHGRRLGVRQPFLYRLCDAIIAENEGAYPELRERQAFIERFVRAEEERFSATIESGLQKLDAMIEGLKAAGGRELAGADAFRLYDTDGFPLDLTLEILAQHGLTADREGFERLMHEQRVRAKAARAGAGGVGWEDGLSLADIPATVFTGYTDTRGHGALLAIVQENELVGRAAVGQTAAFVFDKTPFYAESGGQSADTGVIEAGDASIRVTQVRRTPDGKVLHVGSVAAGEIAVGDTAALTVDLGRRRALARAHSATHLLHHALRQALGAHVEQAGSLVEADALRFDFTHVAPMTPDELRAVQDAVNDAIFDNLPVDIEEMPIEQAKKLGATALFGEKYGDIVRVVRMGDVSVELCGGTHAESTAAIGLFRMVSEGSVAAGVRRIEAICGAEVLRKIEQTEFALRQVAESIKAAPGDVVRRAAQVASELREANRMIETLHGKLARFSAVDLLGSAREIGPIRVVVAKVDDTGADNLRALGDTVRDRAPNCVCVLAAVTAEGKINFAATCGKNAIEHGAHAGNILRDIAKMTGGGGGGRADSATAGGREPDKLALALTAVEDVVKRMIK